MRTKQLPKLRRLRPARGFPALLRATHCGLTHLTDAARERQLWVVFRRYSDFVRLRQQLVDLGQPSHTKRDHDGKGRNVASGNDAPHDSTGSVAVPRAAPLWQQALERSRTVLEQHKFPRRLHFSGADTLRQERRRSLQEFMAALVSGRAGAEVVEWEHLLSSEY